MTQLIVRTDDHGFGLIIPKKTGIIFEHQCDGLVCNQIQQEGIFVPLPKRYFKSQINSLGDEEFYYEEEDFPFEFDIITFDGMNEKELISSFMHEAYDWIIFRGWKNKSDYRAKQFKRLEGKKMLLIYKNSD